MYKQLKDGKDEAESIETLDVSSLFDDDVRGLQPKEASCLKFIAKNTPIDWSEIIENFGQDSISILHERRLIIRSGDRLNIYWDIFREYLNTGEAPKVPFSYLPSVSISSIITVGCLLKHAVGTSHAEISEIVGLREGTIGNVVRDLRMFGIAAGTGALPTLLAGIPENDPKGILRKLREVLERHSFLIELRKMSDGAVLRPSEIQELIQDTHSIPDFSPDTLRSNAGRICIWLAAAGYLQNTSAGWRYGDQGEIDLSHISRKRRDWRVFNGSAPPPRALEVLEKLRENGILSAAEASNPGYEKALNVLSRFELAVQFENSSWKLVAPDRFDAPADAKTRLWNAAKKQESLKAAVDFMKKNSNADGMELANYLEKEFDETWAEGSKRRTGNALRRWGDWIIEGERLGSVPTPKEGIRGRRKGWRKKT